MNQSTTMAAGEAAALGVVRTSLNAEGVLAKAREASRRGRLPGFEAGGDGGLFSVLAFATPFDRRLVAHVDAGEGGSVVRFALRLRPLMPLVFLGVTLTTIWPGVWITESMLESYFPGSWIARYTWWWYMPLTVLPLPWAGWSMWRKSAAAALASAHEAIAALAKELGGTIESAG
ncbi:MAG: hypothetical protein SFY96_06645 [Planctomycetota bacterium]|nr:hypothetical protein [Planctomycetota bacterium]